MAGKTKLRRKDSSGAISNMYSNAEKRYLLADDNGSFEPSWWAAGASRGIGEKLSTWHLKKSNLKCIADYFALPSVTRIIIMLDGNMSGNYFRVFMYFADDKHRYFDTNRSPWEQDKEGSRTIAGSQWTVQAIDEHTYDYRLLRPT